MGRGSPRVPWASSRLLIHITTACSFLTYSLALLVPWPPGFFVSWLPGFLPSFLPLALLLRSYSGSGSSSYLRSGSGRSLRLPDLLASGQPSVPRIPLIRPPVSTVSSWKVSLACQCVYGRRFWSGPGAGCGRG